VSINPEVFCLLLILNFFSPPFNTAYSGVEFEFNPLPYDQLWDTQDVDPGIAKSLLKIVHENAAEAKAMGVQYITVACLIHNGNTHKTGHPEY